MNGFVHTKRQDSNNYFTFYAQHEIKYNLLLIEAFFNHCHPINLFIFTIFPKLDNIHFENSLVILPSPSYPTSSPPAVNDRGMCNDIVWNSKLLDYSNTINLYILVISGRTIIRNTDSGRKVLESRILFICRPSVLCRILMWMNYSKVYETKVKHWYLIQLVHSSFLIC